MAQDSYGNYIADVQSAGEISPPAAQLLSDSGVPADSLGSDGSLYVDVDTGDVYEKIGGAWVLFTGSGSGSSNIFRFDGDPNGSVSATGPAIVLGHTASAGDVWVKNTAGTSNSEWTHIIDAP